MPLSAERFARELCAQRPEVSVEAAGAFAAEASAAHPTIKDPDAARFAQAVVQRMASKTLEQLNAADLYLAQGAVRSDGAALKAFAQLCRRRVPQVLASMRQSPALVEEVEERLQEKLVVPVNGKPARLVEYQGSGSLAAWVGVAAVRIAIELSRLKRYQQADHGDEQASDAAITDGDPEFDLLKGTQAKRFKEAFQTAFTGLSVEDRSLLRMHLKEALSIDQLAVMLQIHRATAARRIVKAKQTLLEGMKAVLAGRFRMSQAEINSDLRRIEPNLDLSLSRLLLASTRRS